MCMMCNLNCTKMSRQICKYYFVSFGEVAFLLNAFAVSNLCVCVSCKDDDADDSCF